jgi:predicted RNase H-like nuclease (RuvC/YqgF family)
LGFSVLRETIESNDTEITHLRRRCDALSVEVQALTKENLTLLSEKNQEISQLHGELKMKSFQLTALGVTFEVNTR